MSIKEKWEESMKGVAVFGTIRCPRNYVIKPGCQPFKIIPNPRLKHMTDANIAFLNKELKSTLKKWMFARDKNGNKIQDFRSFYQPSVSKAYIIEHVYDPMNPICKMKCRGSCLRGIGSINTQSIKRLR